MGMLEGYLQAHICDLSAPTQDSKHTGALLCLYDSESAVLLASAALTANSFWRVDRFAGKLMFPYLAWLILANALNLNITAKNESVSIF